MTKRKWIKVCAFVLTMVFLFGMAGFLGYDDSVQISVSAAGSSELEQAQQELSNIKKQQSEIESQLEKLQQSKEQSMQEKLLMEQDLQVTNEKLAALNSVLSGLETELAAKRKELEQVQANLDQCIEQFRVRARASYEAGETSYLEVFLSSSSLSDMLTKIDLMTEVAEYDKSLINDVKNSYTQIEALYQEIEEKTNQQQAAVDEVAAVAAEQQRKVDALDALVASINSQSSSLQTESAILEERQAELDKKIAELASSNDSYYGDELCWPVPASGRVTSKFGYREFDHSFHYAIDIGASHGSPVVAVADGKVIRARWVTTGGGMQVAIDHGSKLVTYYNHLSGFACSEGQRVSKGQVIGYVGQTGNAFGNHLDFKISYRGTYYDPELYIVYGNGKPPKSIHSLIG